MTSDEPSRPDSSGLLPTSGAPEAVPCVEKGTDHDPPADSREPSLPSDEAKQLVEEARSLGEALRDAAVKEQKRLRRAAKRKIRRAKAP